MKEDDGAVACAKELMTELVAAWNAHDPVLVASFYHPDFVGADVNQKKPLEGTQAIRRAMEYQLVAFPDLHISAEATIVEGDRVVLVWTMSGTHRGRIMNIPPTGRNVEFRGATVVTIRDKKIVGSLRIWDVAAMLRCLGCLPDL